MTRDELAAKFRGNAGLRLPADKVERAIAAARGLAAASTLGPLVATLIP